MGQSFWMHEKADTVLPIVNIQLPDKCPICSSHVIVYSCGNRLREGSIDEHSCPHTEEWIDLWNMRVLEPEQPIIITTQQVSLKEEVLIPAEEPFDFDRYNFDLSSLKGRYQ